MVLKLVGNHPHTLREEGLPEEFVEALVLLRVMLVGEGARDADGIATGGRREDDIREVEVAGRRRRRPHGGQERKGTDGCRGEKLTERKKEEKDEMMRGVTDKSDDQRMREEATDAMGMDRRPVQSPATCDTCVCGTWLHGRVFLHGIAITSPTGVTCPTSRCNMRLAPGYTRDRARAPFVVVYLQSFGTGLVIE